MVKFGKKFFFDASYTKKAKRKMIIGGGILIVGIIILLVSLSFFKKDEKVDKKKGNTILLRDEVSTEINLALPDKTSYFEKLENVKLDNISIKYPENLELSVNVDECPVESVETINSIFDGTVEGNLDDYDCIKNVPTKIGSYEVIISLNKKEYKVQLNVVDTTPPVLALKPLEISAGSSYSIDDFIESCSDNTQGACTYSYYYNPYEEDESELDYSSYNAEGSYEIKIMAKDTTGNASTPETTTLTVVPKAKNKYLVTYNTNGGSAINGEYVEEGSMVSRPKDPTKNNSTFAGWSLNGAIFDFSTPITGEITLDANWNSNPQKPKPNVPSCRYGNKNYDTNNIIAVFADASSKCASALSEFNSLRDGPLVNNTIAKEVNRLRAYQTESGYTFCDNCIGIETDGILNSNGTGIVGYQLIFNIQQRANGTSVEVARYRIDTNGKRHFSLNTINLPE